MSLRCSFLFAILALAVACVPRLPPPRSSPTMSREIRSAIRFGVVRSAWTFNVIDPIVIEALGPSTAVRTASAAPSRLRSITARLSNW